MPIPELGPLVKPMTEEDKIKLGEFIGQRYEENRTREINRKRAIHSRMVAATRRKVASTLTAQEGEGEWICSINEGWAINEASNPYSHLQNAFREMPDSITDEISQYNNAGNPYAHLQNAFTPNPLLDAFNPEIWRLDATKFVEKKLKEKELSEKSKEETTEKSEEKDNTYDNDSLGG